jgi:maleamate amidohydrolase
VTALLLVDMIKAFFDRDGEFYYEDSKGTLDAGRRLLEAARRGGRLVVHARDVHRRGLADGEGVKLPPHCVEGTLDVEFAPGLEPAPGEIELQKRRYSAFFGTELALLLREQRVGRVVVAGVKTNVCVRATVQDALAEGLEVVVPREAVSSNRPHLHEATLEDVERYFGRVVDLAEGERLLEGPE